MDVAQTLWGNLQKGHQTAVDHRGSGTLAGEGRDVKIKFKKKKKMLSKKEKCLNSDDARCQTLQNSIICLSHLTQRSTSVLLVTWIPKLLPVSQANICKLYLELISFGQLLVKMQSESEPNHFVFPVQVLGLWSLSDPTRCSVTYTAECTANPRKTATFKCTAQPLKSSPLKNNCNNNRGEVNVKSSKAAKHSWIYNWRYYFFWRAAVWEGNNNNGRSPTNLFSYLWKKGAGQ